MKRPHLLSFRQESQFSSHQGRKLAAAVNRRSRAPRPAQEDRGARRFSGEVPKCGSRAGGLLYPSEQLRQLSASAQGMGLLG